MKKLYLFYVLNLLNNNLVKQTIFNHQLILLRLIKTVFLLGCGKNFVIYIRVINFNSLNSNSFS